MDAVLIASQLNTDLNGANSSTDIINAMMWYMSSFCTLLAQEGNIPPPLVDWLPVCNEPKEEGNQFSHWSKGRCSIISLKCACIYFIFLSWSVWVANSVEGVTVWKWGRTVRKMGCRRVKMYRNYVWFFMPISHPDVVIWPTFWNFLPLSWPCLSNSISVCSGWLTFTSIENWNHLLILFTCAVATGGRCLEIRSYNNSTLTVFSLYAW